MTRQLWWSVLFTLILMVGVAIAQSQNQPDQKPPASSSQVPQPKPEAPISEKAREQQEKETQKERPQRILGVVPQFTVTDIKNARPLKPSQKFGLFARSAFDPVQFAIVGVQAGISQATNSFSAYGQGAEGFGKRYGAAFADQASSGFWGTFVYPSLLKQDPRYFRLGEGSFSKRTSYAVSRVFVTHADQGGKPFNFSGIMGALTAGGISNAYYPSQDRGVGLTFSRTGIALGYTMAGYVFNEFWPDIHHKFFKNKQ